MVDAKASEDAPLFKVETYNPPTAKTKDAIFWVDLETTGLDPERCSIVEFCAIVTNFDGAPIGSVEGVLGDWAMERPAPYHWRTVAPPYWEPAAHEMHTRSGLLKACEASLATPVEMVEAMGALIDRCVPDRGSGNIYVGGSSVHFDVAFLRRVWAQGWPFHYRLMDMSAVSLFLETMGIPRKKSSDIHRARADVLYALRAFELFRRTIRLDG